MGWQVENGHFRDHQASWRNEQGLKLEAPKPITLRLRMGLLGGSGFGWGEQSWQLSAAVSLLWEQ